MLKFYEMPNPDINGKLIINWDGLVPLGILFILVGIGMIAIGIFFVKMRIGGV